jgi:hypothetical protein
MNNLKNDPLALALNLTLRVLNLTLTLRVLVLVLNMAQGGQYLSQLLRHLRVVCSHDAFQICNLLRHICNLLRHLRVVCSHDAFQICNLLRHLRVVCSHDAFQICNPLPDIADWYNPSTRYKYLRGIFTEVVNDAGVGDGDHQISDLVIPF